MFVVAAAAFVEVVAGCVSVGVGLCDIVSRSSVVEGNVVLGEVVVNSGMGVGVEQQPFPQQPCEIGQQTFPQHVSVLLQQSCPQQPNEVEQHESATPFLVVDAEQIC